VFGDFSKGFVRGTFAGAVDDDGVGINWNVLTRAINTTGAGLDRAYWRRLLVNCFGMATGTAITATFFYNPTVPSSVHTQTKSIPSVTALSPFLGWGLDPWSTSPWGSTSVAFTTDMALEFGMGVIANSVVVSLDGTGPGKIRGMELHARQKALTKSTTVNA